MFGASDFNSSGDALFRAGEGVDEVVLSPAHHAASSRFFSRRKSTASTPVAASRASGSGSDEWQCECCEGMNAASAVTCSTCLANRPKNPVAKAKQSSPVPTFSFGESAPAVSFGGPQSFTGSESFQTRDRLFSDSAAPTFQFGDAPPNHLTTAPTVPMPTFLFGGDSAAGSGPATGTFAAPADTYAFSFGGGVGGGGVGAGGAAAVGGSFLFGDSAVPVNLAANSSAGPVSGWKCECCEQENAESAATCVTCLANKPSNSKKAAGGGMQMSSFAAPPAASAPLAAPATSGRRGWVCKCCDRENGESDAKCSDCLVPRPTAANSAKTATPAPSAKVASVSPTFGSTPIAPSASSRTPVASSLFAAPAASFSTPAPASKPLATNAAQWICQACDTDNNANVAKCRICGYVNKGVSTAVAAPEERGSGSLKSFVAVALSSKHVHAAEKFFSRRRKPESVSSFAVSPRTPTEHSFSSNEGYASDSSVITDVTFNLTPVASASGKKSGGAGGGSSWRSSASPNFGASSAVALREKKPRDDDVGFVTPDLPRYEKKVIRRNSDVPTPPKGVATWKCKTCDWENEANVKDCVLCLDPKF